MSLISEVLRNSNVSSGLIILFSRRTFSSNQVGPGRAFVDGFKSSLRKQIKENRQMAENIRLLTAETTRLTDSESLKRAKQLMEEESSAIRSHATRQAEKIVKQVSETVAKAADSSVGRAASVTIQSTARVMSHAARPIVESETYKKVSSDVSRAIHDTSGRYGGFASAELREKTRALRAESWAAARRRAYPANYTATAITNTRDANSPWSQPSKLQDKWDNFKNNNPILRAIIKGTEAVDKSDNIVVSWSRWLVHRVQDKLGFIVEETETARALAVIKIRNPEFKIDLFINDARDFILPEILTAWLSGDRQVLRRWCSHATYSQIAAGLSEIEKQSLVNTSQILELRNLDMVTAKVLENNVPAVVLSFQTYETLVYHDIKTDIVALGSESKVHECSYVVVFTLDEENEDPITHGWKMIDQAKSSSGTIL